MALLLPQVALRRAKKRRMIGAPSLIRAGPRTRTLPGVGLRFEALSLPQTHARGRRQIAFRGPLLEAAAPRPEEPQADFALGRVGKPAAGLGEE